MADYEDNEQTAEETQNNADDDSWIDGLSHYESPQRTYEPTPAQQAAPQREEPRPRNLQYFEDTAADEIKSQIVDPELDDMRGQLQDLRRMTEAERRERTEALQTSANNKILAKFPRAKDILNSKQFVDYLSKNDDPYASEGAYDRLQKAYNRGDAEYVIKRLSDFASTVKKPKPNVAVEPTSAASGDSGRSQKSAPKVMSEEEYRVKRQKIRAKPRRERKKGEMKELANLFLGGI